MHIYETSRNYPTTTLSQLIQDPDVGKSHMSSPAQDSLRIARAPLLFRIYTCIYIYTRAHARQAFLLSLVNYPVDISPRW